MSAAQSCEQCGVRVRQGFVPPQRTQRRQTRFAVDRLFCSISCMDTWSKSPRARDDDDDPRQLRRAGHTHACERHGEHIGTECPVCKGLRKSGPRPWRVGRSREVEARLRARPKSGPIDESGYADA